MEEYKITDAEISQNNVKSAADKVDGSPQENKHIFDKLPELIILRLNGFVQAVAEKFLEYYTKIEIDNKETALNSKIGFKANDADVYKKAETYTKDEVNKVIGDRIAAIGGGDMAQVVYDANMNGIVDDAEKLGGQLPEYYATKAEAAEAKTAANEADAKANNAQTAADNAQTAADNAQATADTAVAAAATAQTKADEAMPKSGGTFMGDAVAISTNRDTVCLRNSAVTNSAWTILSTDRIVFVRK